MHSIRTLFFFQLQQSFFSLCAYFCTTIRKLKRSRALDVDHGHTNIVGRLYKGNKREWRCLGVASARHLALHSTLFDRVQGRSVNMRRCIGPLLLSSLFLFSFVRGYHCILVSTLISWNACYHLMLCPRANGLLLPSPSLYPWRILC